MKLKELLGSPYFIYECEDQLILTEIALNEIKNIDVLQKGGPVKKALQGITGFAKKHPFIVGAMSAYALDAIKKYNRNKRKTITFFTKDVIERKMFKDIVKTLMATGKYRKIKDTRVEGGYLMMLKRLD